MSTTLLSILCLGFVIWVIIGYFVLVKLLNSDRVSPVDLTWDPGLLVMAWPYEVYKAFRSKQK